VCCRDWDPDERWTIHLPGAFESRANARGLPASRERGWTRDGRFLTRILEALRRLDRHGDRPRRQPAPWPAHVLAQLWSGGLFSRGAMPQAQVQQPALRGFWCRLNADLVIYGASDPKAKVSIQGQPIQLRKDGTFSIRMTSPRNPEPTFEFTSPTGWRPEPS